jgi:PAS domain S-box-containing protein
MTLHNTRRIETALPETGENGTVGFKHFLPGASERDSCRRRTQTEHKDIDEGLRLTLDMIPGLVYSLSPDCEIQYANSHVTDYLGKTLQELQSGAWIETFHPNERDAVMASMTRHFAKGQGCTMEYRLRRFDGTYRRFQATVQPLSDHQGKPVSWYGLLTDVENQRTAEELLQRMRGQLSQTSQYMVLTELPPSELVESLCALSLSGQAGLRWLSAEPPNVDRAFRTIECIVQYAEGASEFLRSMRELGRPQSTFAFRPGEVA